MRDATQHQEQQDHAGRADNDDEMSSTKSAGSMSFRNSLIAKPHIFDSLADELHRQTVIRPWSSLLERTIATDILPRMLANHMSVATQSEDPAPPSAAEVDVFISLILADAVKEACEILNGFARAGVSRDVILRDLLTPAAQRLGDLWDTDQADFAAVTIAMIRLNQILRDTAPQVSEAPMLRGHERHLLIAAAPGETHSFGVAILSDLFRRAGWIVQSESILTRTGLMTLVRRNWFDVVGLSVSGEGGLKALPGVIRALRRTALNPEVGVMVGGKAFSDHPERAQFVGADATAHDGQSALFEADTMIERAHAARR